MDFIDEVRTRAGRFASRVEHLETEEATKSSLVMPFLQMLGYNIFDPTEVVPEFTADVGGRRGEKVDYALMREGKPAVLIEVKRYGTKLEGAETAQLFRYFTVTDAHFGILTDGIVYHFFSDLDQTNLMDKRPFFEFNMLDFSDAHVDQLKRFQKDSYDESEIVEAATGLKYTAEIRRVLSEEFAGPSQDLVNLIVRRVYPDARTANSVRRQFHALAPAAFTQFINDRIDIRLKYARQTEEREATPPANTAAQEEEQAPEFVPAELDALNVIKAIVRDVVDVRRVGLRSLATYCSVLLDDNRRRTVCRLRLRTDNWRLLLHDGGSEERIPLDDLDDLFSHASRLRASVAAVLSPGQPFAEPDTEQDAP